MKIKTKNKVTLEIFKPISIRLLKNLSDIDTRYKDNEEDLEVGTITQLEYDPGGLSLEYSGRCYISTDTFNDNIEMVEGRF